VRKRERNKSDHFDGAKETEEREIPIELLQFYPLFILYYTTMLWNCGKNLYKSCFLSKSGELTMNFCRFWAFFKDPGDEL
jgi:hypothetical protein